MTNQTNSISVRRLCGGIVAILTAIALLMYFAAFIYLVAGAEGAFLRISFGSIILGIAGILFALINLLPTTEEEKMEAVRQLYEPADTSKVQTGTEETGTFGSGHTFSDEV